MKKQLLLLIGAPLLFACHPEIDTEEVSIGSIDPSRYVAIGGSSTAGYMDDALYADGQENGFANIIAEQLSLAATTSFSIPLVNAGSVGSNLSNQSQLHLGYKTDCKGVTGLSPLRISASGDASIFSNISSSGNFTNKGIPGMHSIFVNNSTYGSTGHPDFNPFYGRIAMNAGSSTILQDAVAAAPSFFTIQLGEDDILRYAQSGGTAALPAPANGPSGTGFDGTLEEVLQALTANGAKGILGDIPSIPDFPYFTTIPWNGLNLTADNALTLNQVYNPLNIYFSEGANGFTIQDISQPFGVRKMLPDELILLSIPLDSVKCYGMGSINPIPNKYVLTQDEIALIQTAIEAYNTVIRAKANQYGLGVANVSDLYSTFKPGILYNGVNVSSTFVSGGAFSLDGRNLNPIGQAFLANAYIKAINTTYGARIPLADPTRFRGVKFP